ncbi:MAG: glycerophosphodiester phosphodiesterase family protein [Pseudomonadota bacterium]
MDASITTPPNVTDPGRIIAHRGAKRAAPENTLAAFRKAAEQGVRWVEFDVSLLGDGTAVVHHDATLDRCSLSTGPLSALGSADLEGVDMGARFSDLYRGEPLPTLAEALDLIEALGFHANLEIKPHEVAPAANAEATAKHLTERPWTRERIIVSSYCKATLHALRPILSGQPMAMLFESPPDDWLRVIRELNAAALHMDYRYLSEKIARAARREGVDLRVYTINRPELVAPFRDLGLTSVITDHPPLFLDNADWAAWAKR